MSLEFDTRPSLAEMIHLAILFIACLPLVLRAITFVVPDRYLELYAWWDARSLNGDGGSKWRNMGWWQVCLALIPGFRS